MYNKSNYMNDYKSTQATEHRETKTDDQHGLGVWENTFQSLLSLCGFGP